MNCIVRTGVWQIGDAIGRPAGELFDDDDLMEELKELEEAGIEEQILASPAVPEGRPAVAERKEVADYDLPAVPMGAPASTPAAVSEPEDEDAKALRELEASMSLA